MYILELGKNARNSNFPELFVQSQMWIVWVEAKGEFVLEAQEIFKNYPTYNFFVILAVQTTQGQKLRENTKNHKVVG